DDGTRLPNRRPADPGHAAASARRAAGAAPRDGARPARGGAGRGRARRAGHDRDRRPDRERGRGGQLLFLALGARPHGRAAPHCRLGRGRPRRSGLPVDAPRGPPAARPHQGPCRVGVADGRRRALLALDTRAHPRLRRPGAAGGDAARPHRPGARFRPAGRGGAADRRVGARTADLGRPVHRGHGRLPARQRPGAGEPPPAPLGDRHRAREPVRVHRQRGGEHAPARGLAGRRAGARAAIAGGRPLRAGHAAHGASRVAGQHHDHALRGVARGVVGGAGARPLGHRHPALDRREPARAVGRGLPAPRAAARL
ncbi:MAG: hypothetical protein AVDCRST_MAG68-3947, partial [uncultured Gemmatimonadetes bacterium]